MPAGCDIVAVGTSAGGVEALRALASRLPAGLPAAVLVARHVSPDVPSILPEILSRAGRLPAVHAVDGTAVEHGRIYVAPPDRHMTVEDSRLRLLRGPKENGFRPAIDPLFRSAAEAFQSRVAGVILTGGLNDGVAGLMAVKLNGGVAIVQHPEEAPIRAMPESALEMVPVDYVLPLAGIADLIVKLAKAGRRESDGTPSVFTCPECHGALRELRDGEQVEYRCRGAHVFSASGLVEAKHEDLGHALWAAARTLEENASLSRRLAAQAQARQQSALAERLETRAKENEKQAAVLRKWLTGE